MTKYIIEYVGGTKGDMVCRFLNKLEPNLDDTGKSKPVDTDSPRWLKLLNPFDLTLARFEEALSLNTHEFVPAHPLWITYNKDYRDLLEKYDYKIYSIKFEEKHYVTILIESLLKNMIINKNETPVITWSNMGTPWKILAPELVDIMNILFFDGRKVPDWFKNAMSENDIDFADLDFMNVEEKRKERIEGILSVSPHVIYKKRARVFKLYNEMLDHRTILNYEDLYMGNFPFYHIEENHLYEDDDEREDEWNHLVESSWCDYVGNDYRKFVIPKLPINWQANLYSRTIEKYLKQWKK